ncbi:hypothetical protein ACF0H5_002357 [Mactra antiquata]
MRFCQCICRLLREVLEVLCCLCCLRYLYEECISTLKSFFKTDNKYERVPYEAEIDIYNTRDVYETKPEAKQRIRSRARVQVYNCRDNVKKFVEDLLKQVNEELDVLYITHASEISLTSPLLVICFNTSRLGTVADNAIREISAPRSAVLLVFHHKESHALPSQHSDKRLVGDKFSSLYGIYDIACVTGKGVYPHDMNTQAVSKVKQYIEQYNYCIMENESVAK